MSSQITNFEAVVIRSGRISLYVLALLIVGLVGFVSPVLVCIVVGYLSWRYYRTKPRYRDTHGNARWADTPELLSANLLFQKRGFFIGRALGLSPLATARELTYLFFSPLRRSWKVAALTAIGKKRAGAESDLVVPTWRVPHLAIFGSSGCGKSTCFAIQQILRSRFAGLIVLDPKGELASITADRLVKQKRNVFIFDPFNLSMSKLAKQCNFNPLSFFWHDESKIVDEARRLAAALVLETGEEKDPFWINSARNLVTATLSFLMAHANKKDCNLNNAREILSSTELMKDMLQRMQQSNRCGNLLTRLANQVSQLEGQTKAGVYSVANSNIEFLDSLAIADRLSQTSFKPEVLLDPSTCLYICLPVDRINELAGVQRLLLTAIINYLFAAGEDRNRQVQFVLDESATLGAMDSLYAALNFGRSFGMNLMFLFQSTSQVERCFPKSQRNDFFGTTATVFAGVNDLATAKEVSEWMGQSTVVSVSQQRGDNWGKSAASDTANMNVNTNWGGNRSSSENEVARPLLRAEEVLQIPSYAAIALIPNIRPILVEKVPYYNKNRGIGYLRRTCSFLVYLAISCGTSWVLYVLIAAELRGDLLPALADLRRAIIDSLVE